MTQDQLKCIQLRDCFYAGYSMPQYCVDRDIRRPLIASYDPSYLWELHVQFKFDKRIFPEYRVISRKAERINYSRACTAGGLRVECFDPEEAGDFDRVIMLTTNKFSRLPEEKTIYFDVLLDQITRYVYAERPLYNYINNHKNVRVIVTDYPVLRVDENSTVYERHISAKSIWALKNELRNKNSDILETRLDRFGYCNEDVLNLLMLSGADSDSDGSTRLKDNEHPLVQIRSGVRKTAYQEGEYKNTIWCAGTCTFYGIGAPFDKTIESCLQKIINENGHEYRVENISQFYAGRYQDIFYNLNRIPVEAGDIVLVCLQGLRAEHIPFFETTDMFRRPHDYGEVFLDGSHINENGNKVYAEKFFEFLKENDFFQKYEYENIPAHFSSVHKYGILQKDKITADGVWGLYYADLEEYKQRLREMHMPIGSIVMNCNPFTLGHRYLAEYAAEQVERLYIFVVEEDKSFFPFEDRIELVRKGTADLKNVTVIPSGKFIISQLTFSGYFNKAELQDSIIDANEDVEIFGRDIAPQLGITVRFAGEEPFDSVTRQYNDTMAEVLPKYGVTFRVIPRKEAYGSVISASRMRSLLKEGRFAEIEKFVPCTTMNYINENFKSKEMMS